jgi:hypothetical protein
MTNKNRRRRDVARQPRAERPAQAASRAPRPGLMNSLFSARVAGTSNMPRVRSTFVRGFVLVISTPVMLVGSVALVFLAWIGALLGGFQGPAALLGSTLAMPPIGTLFDLQITSRLTGGGDVVSTLLALLPFAVTRAVVLGVFLGLAVEILESGRPSFAGARRGLLVSPMFLIVTIVEIGFLFVASFLGGALGQGLSLFVEIATVAASLYLLAYAPVAQLREGRGVLESLSRSTSAARIPGTSALAMSLLYGIPALLVVQTASGGFDVNPAPGIWIFVLFMNILHVSVLVTYAYRWMCIEDEVPEAPAPRARAARRR